MRTVVTQPESKLFSEPPRRPFAPSVCLLGGWRAGGVCCHSHLCARALAPCTAPRPQSVTTAAQQTCHVAKKPEAPPSQSFAKSMLLLRAGARGTLIPLSSKLRLLSQPHPSFQKEMVNRKHLDGQSSECHSLCAQEILDTKLPYKVFKQD